MRACVWQACSPSAPVSIGLRQQVTSTSEKTRATQFAGSDSSTDRDRCERAFTQKTGGGYSPESSMNRVARIGSEHPSQSHSTSENHRTQRVLWTVTNRSSCVKQYRVPENWLVCRQNRAFIDSQTHGGSVPMPGVSGSRPEQVELVFVQQWRGISVTSSHGDHVARLVSVADGAGMTRNAVRTIGNDFRESRS